MGFCGALCALRVHGTPPKMQANIWANASFTKHVNKGNRNKSPTAGVRIRCTLGLCWHFCCRGPISNPRPVLDFPAQTARGKVFDFFVKAENELVTLVFGKRCFLSFFTNKIGSVGSNRFFSKTEAYYERKSSC